MPKTALLSIHMINDIVAPDSAFGGLFAEQIAQRDLFAVINKASAQVRSRDGIVIHVCIALEEDYSNGNADIPLLAMAEQAGALKSGTPGTQLHENIEVKDEDIVFFHDRPGPFTNTNLQQILNEAGVDTVVVCGVSTNLSVEGTVRQASDLDYATYVLDDASAAADADAHQAALNSMSLLAKVITTDELAALA